MPNTKLTIIRLLVALLFVGVPLSRAEVRHLPAPSAKGTISEGQAYSIILQAMALRENVLHAANLAPEDERQAKRPQGSYPARLHGLYSGRGFCRRLRHGRS